MPTMSWLLKNVRQAFQRIGAPVALLMFNHLLNDRRINTVLKNGARTLSYHDSAWKRSGIPIPA